MKLPQFQREFVWNVEKSAKLIDSILKNYPIGSLIIWDSEEMIRAARNLGDIEFATLPKGTKFEYILDGQQRLTSIIAAVLGLTVKGKDFSSIYIDLEETIESSELVQIKKDEDLPAPRYISLKLLTSNDLTILDHDYRVHLKKIEAYKKHIMEYDVSIIHLDDCPLDIATEVFARLNIGGKKLTDFEIMVAKTYSLEHNFDLKEKFKELVDELDKVHYKKFDDQSLLQVIALLHAQNSEKDCSKKTILNLSREDVMNTWDDAVLNIKRASEYLREHLGVRIIEILPYSAILVVLAYFFSKLDGDSPSAKQDMYLTDYFWRASLGYRYTTGPDTKIKADCHRMDVILKEEKQPSYDWSIKSNITADYLLENGEFKLGSSYIKGLICLLVSQNPHSFDKNLLVKITRDHLLTSTSKNYHHFFPKDYLKKSMQKTGVKWRYMANHVLNITLVGDLLNKRKIGTRAPSDYMQEFLHDNPKLNDTMKTHLINNLDEFGVWNDNYDDFIEGRAVSFSDTLRTKVILTKDEKEQALKNNTLKTFLEEHEYENDDSLYLCELMDDNLFALGRYNTKEGKKVFTILKGSRMRLGYYHNEKRTRTWLDERIKIIEQDVAIEKEDYYEFVEDYDFERPSHASATVLGREAYHSYFWKNYKGENISTD